MPGGKAPRAAGDRFERMCFRNLSAAGWLTVRSAGSFGPCDLVALKRGRPPVLVQCKKTDNLTRAGRLALWNVGRQHGAIAVVVSNPQRGFIQWSQITEVGSYQPFQI